MAENSFITILLVINTVILAILLKDTFAELEEVSLNHHHPNEEEFRKPYIIVAKGGVDVTFRNPNIPRNAGDEQLSYKFRMKKIQTCLPYLREYDEPVKVENQGLMEDIPSHMPVFNERANMVDLKFTSAEYKKRIAKDWQSYNPVLKLRYYKNFEITDEMYNDDPAQGKDFAMPHMGIFNNPDYCNYHDYFILNNPEIALKKLYFFSDYHPLSIPRYFAFGKFGKDTIPKVSKNMKRLNWFQRLYSLDPRTSIFYTKKAAFHGWHEIGKHFACWGQSFNHIPGHGLMTRKDLLVTSANDYLAKWQAKPHLKKCFNETSFFPLSYRLYEKSECEQYFDLIQTDEYLTVHKNASEVQHVLKVGYGVHRGVGVYLIDNEVEQNLLSNYSRGEKCGEIDENLVAQKYFYDPFTVNNGHKFDFRIYMMIVSTDPLIVYYHDGFLRVSLFKYDKENINRKAHLTNTELAKEIFKKVENEGGTHDGMNIEQLRAFQMRTLPTFQKYLTENKIVKDKNWVENKLKTDFKKAYIHLVKMCEKGLLKNPSVFEIFGVDFVMDDQMESYVIEVNASPMQVGTSKEKTALMKSLNEGVVKITLAYLRSRVKRSIEFIRKHAQDIKKGHNMKKLSQRFREINRNYLEPEYESELEGLTWERVVDENLEGAERYGGLIDEECIETMNE